MTAWRVGVAIKPERQFGVEDTSQEWHYIGVGMDMTISENNNWKFQNGLGSKTAQLEYEGRFTGSFNGNLYLDYNNFYWLLFGLEGYGFYLDEQNHVGYHVFSPCNSKSLRSFSMRFVKLDRTVGGPYDEEMVMLGCVMNKVNPSYESTSQAVKCAFAGKYVDTALTAMELLDNKAYTTGKNKITPINWGCLQVLSQDGTEWEKVANNEKTSFSFDRTINTVPECGSRIDTAFYEGNVSTISVGATVYSRNANQWHTRMHTGGVRNDIAVGGISRPRRKGLEGIPDIRIASATEDGNYSFIAQFEEAVVNEWGNTYNAGSEIVESPRIQQTNGVLVVKTPDILTSLEDGTVTKTARTVVYNFGEDPETQETKTLTMYYTDGYSIHLIKQSRTGYVLSGWQYTKDGQVMTYVPGEEVMLTEDMEFVAQWTAINE